MASNNQCTWISTDVGGHPTFLPVLVGCKFCGGTHGGIILWNLPAISHVSFQLPRFPKLPKFHLPCIVILGVKLGDCPAKVDQESSEDDSKESKKTEDSKPTSTDGSTSTSESTSSESCTSSQTTSDCSTICTATLASPGQALPATPPCSTTCYSTRRGCDVTGSTTITTTTSGTAQICAPSCSACNAPYTPPAVTPTCSDCMPGTGIPMGGSPSTALILPSSPVVKERTFAEEYNYGSLSDPERRGLWYMLIEAYDGVQKDGDWLNIQPYNSPIWPGEGVSASLTYSLGRPRGQKAIKGMYGCTSVQ
jgi:hypothetical protein